MRARAQVKSIKTSSTFSPLRRLSPRQALLAPTPALLPRYRLRSRNLLRLCKNLSRASRPPRRKPNSASRRRAMHPAHRVVSLRTTAKRGFLPRIHRPHPSCRPPTTGSHSQRTNRAMTIRLEEERGGSSCQQDWWNRLRRERPCPRNDRYERRRDLAPVTVADRLSRSSVRAARRKRNRRRTGTRVCTMTTHLQGG